VAARERGFSMTSTPRRCSLSADLVKDLDLASDVFAEDGAVTPLTRETRDLYTAAMGALCGPRHFGDYQVMQQQR